MKLPRRPLTRVLALTSTVAIIGAGAAIAQETVPVTAAVANGARMLAVTGASNGVPVGAPNLNFGSTAAPAPFGVVVTDLLYDHKSYSVDATLTNLYKLGTSGLLCDAYIPSKALNISYTGTAGATDVKAAVDSVLAFTDSDIVDDVNAVLGLDTLTTVTPVTVTGIDGVIQEYANGVIENGVTYRVPAMMTPANGSAAAFADQAKHPDCALEDGAAAQGTSVPVQVGTKTNPDLTNLYADIFAAAAAGDTALTAAEAVAAGMLPPGADEPGGALYEATRSAVDAALTLTLTAAELDAITALVVLDLLASSTQVALSLVGQSGVYANVPVLNLDTAHPEFGDPTRGTYHGVMTVTLTDVG